MAAKLPVHGVRINCDTEALVEDAPLTLGIRGDGFLVTVTSWQRPRITLSLTARCGEGWTPLCSVQIEVGNGEEAISTPCRVHPRRQPPLGGRAWHGMAKQSGYAHGIKPGLQLFEECRQLGL